MDAFAVKDPFGEDVRSNFTGIIFMVSAGKGTIKVNAETTGGMLLKVKIGNDEPTGRASSSGLRTRCPSSAASAWCAARTTRWTRPA
ncbi:MAG: hypothetical protein IJP74_03975 [Prevotella sp.]|nr:hypothetical protein [Prevotella sp.]